MEDEKPHLIAMFSLVLPHRRQGWPEVEALAPSLNEIGINMVWLPPAYKGASGRLLPSAMIPTISLTSASLIKKGLSPQIWRQSAVLAAINALKEHNIIAVLLDVVVNP